MAGRHARLLAIAALVAACSTPAPSTAPSNAPASAPRVTSAAAVTLDIAVESAAATTAKVGAAGGTLNATSAGMTFELEVPPHALPVGTEITMTPISTVGGLPLSGGFVGGVDLQPSGLVLAEPATLTISGARDAGAGQGLVGFTYGDGAGSFGMRPATTNAGAITIAISHFSTAGAGFGTTQDIEALWIIGPTPTTLGSSQNAIDLLAAAFWSAPRDGEVELQLMELWFDLILIHELEAATTDAQLLAAISAYQMWDTVVPANTDLYDFLPGGRDAPSLVSRRATWEAAFVPKVRTAVQANLALCAAPGIASARVAALDNAIFWSRMARLVFGVGTAANSLDLAAFQAGSCASVVKQALTLPDPLSAGVAANLEATWALRFADGAIVPGNFTVAASGTGATLQFPQFTALTPPGFYSGVVTPTGSAVSIGLSTCYAGGEFLLFIASADEICLAETVGSGVGVTCSGDPLTIASENDDPDKIYVVFDGASTCRLVGEIGDDHFPGDGSDVALSIDTDPEETTWDGEDSDDDDDGLNWRDVSGFGQDFPSGATRTFRTRHVATGQVFEITVTVSVQLQSDGRDTRMTVEDVTIVAVS